MNFFDAKKLELIENEKTWTIIKEELAKGLIGGSGLGNFIRELLSDINEAKIILGNRN